MPAIKKAPNTAKTENVSVRLDPKLYYLAGIAARENGRTLSGFIERELRRNLSDAEAMRASNQPIPGHGFAPQLPLWGEELWDVDEADRFYKLATLRFGLLTIPEQRFWKLFTMYLSHNKQKLSIEAFRDFWNSPSINTSHLSEGEE